MTDTIRALTDPLRVKSVQWFFWAVAIVFYGFGDTITTIFGLQATGVAEGGPLVLVVLALGGIPAFILYKTLLVAVFFGVLVRRVWSSTGLHPDGSYRFRRCNHYLEYIRRFLLNYHSQSNSLGIPPNRSYRKKYRGTPITRNAAPRR